MLIGFGFHLVIERLLISGARGRKRGSRPSSVVSISLSSGFSFQGNGAHTAQHTA